MKQDDQSAQQDQAITERQAVYILQINLPLYAVLPLKWSVKKHELFCAVIMKKNDNSDFKIK